MHLESDIKEMIRKLLSKNVGKIYYIFQSCLIDYIIKFQIIPLYI